MYGAFGGYTRWAVVFLIIFVLFFLLVPAAGWVGGSCAGGTGVAVTSYHGYTGTVSPMGGMGMGGMSMGGYGYDSPSSS